MDNRMIFAKNLQRYMNEKEKSRKEVSAAIGVSYYTLTDWVKGKKYPRMDKVELLADYFGILKSDLIEEKSQQPTQSKLSARKKAFMQKVEGMSDDQLERLERILALVENKEV